MSLILIILLLLLGMLNLPLWWVAVLFLFAGSV
jgi:hypothetical protein